MKDVKKIVISYYNGGFIVDNNDWGKEKMTLTKNKVKYENIRMSYFGHDDEMIPIVKLVDDRSVKYFLSEEIKQGWQYSIRYCFDNIFEDIKKIVQKYNCDSFVSGEDIGTVSVNVYDGDVIYTYLSNGSIGDDDLYEIINALIPNDAMRPYFLSGPKYIMY